MGFLHVTAINVQPSVPHEGGGVSTLAVSLDGKWVVSKSSTVTILWDTKRRTIMHEWLELPWARTVPRHTFQFAFSPSCDRLLCSSGHHAEPLLHVRDVASGDVTAVFGRHPTVDCRWTPDGKRLVSVHLVHTGHLYYEVRDGQTFQVLQVRAERPFPQSLIILKPDYGSPSEPDAAREDETEVEDVHYNATVWEPAPGNRSTRPRIRPLAIGNTSPILIAFARDNSRLALSLGDGIMRVWSIESGRELLAGRSLDMRHAVAFTPCTRHFGPPCAAEARGHTLAGYDGDSPYMPKVNISIPEDPWTARWQLLLQSVAPIDLDKPSPSQDSLECEEPASNAESRLRLKKVADWPLITNIQSAWDRSDLPTSITFSPDARTLWWGTRGGMVHSRTL